MTAKKSTRKFKTEVNELLDLIIHSLYSHKEIFLRELISNASDAIDRLKYKAQVDPGLIGDDTEFAIKITPNKENRTLEIADNGIGMTFDEVVENIGTIAKSGTAEFGEMLKSAKDTKGYLPELIGQFGVGFYSAFMVADRITLTTRAAGAQTGVLWESDGLGSYTVEEVEVPHRGTRIVLHLRAPEEGDPDFTDEWTIRNTVKKHSDFVSYPVTMDATRKKPVLDAEGKPVEGQYEDRVETDVLNSMKAIWARPKAEVTDEEYNQFFKHIAHDWQEPLSRLHLKLEGSTEFDALLYIPAHRPFDLFMPERKHGIHLYSRRVFIMDDCKELVPDYLRFVRGVVDSADLSLNVSREILQEDRVVRAIRKTLVRKLLDHIGELDAETYEKFYQEFGVVLKEGIHTDHEQREKLAKLLRYPTTKNGEKKISLDEYIANMKPSQEHIYFITGESGIVLADNPHLEKLKSLDYEIILMSDPVDEFVVEAITEYEGKKLRSAEKGDLGLDGPKPTEEEKKASEGLVKALKDSLGDKVKDVRVSDKLTDSAACLSSDEGEMSAFMLKMLKASGHGMDEKRVLEINPTHPLVAALEGVDAKSPEFGEYAELVFELALVSEGTKLSNPGVFAKKIANLLSKSLK